MILMRSWNDLCNSCSPGCPYFKFQFIMLLTNTETAFQNFIKLDPQPHFVFNLGTRLFEYANPSFYEFFQTKPGNLKAERILKMIQKDDRYRFEKTFCALTPGILHNLQCKIKLPDGLVCTIVLNLVLEVHLGQCLITGRLEDITEKCAHEALLKDQAMAHDQIKRALKHDLSGTLGFIPTFTNLLLKKTEGLDDKQIPVLIASIESISKETLSKIKDYMNDERS